MTLTVQLFAAARELAGRALVVVDLPVGATVAELRVAIRNALPVLELLLPRCAVAVNCEFADESVSISGTDEVAVIPPVSGG